MRCPIDGNELRMTERGGVEIDYCPQCRGVWLDRGELDKILDRVSGEAPQISAPRNEATSQNSASAVWDDAPRNVPQQNIPQQQMPQQQMPQQPAQSGKNLGETLVPALGGLIAGIAANKMSGNRGYHGHKKPKKRKGWMDDMFDFD